MKAASPYIPYADQYSTPQGFAETSTPGGGSAYNFQGSTYVRDANGFKLLETAPGPLGRDVQGNISPLPVPDVKLATPGVLSSANSEDRFAENMTKLSQLQGVPTPTTPTASPSQGTGAGNSINSRSASAENKPTSAPTPAQTDPALAAAEARVAKYDQDLAAFETQISGLRIARTAATAAQIDSIKATFNARRMQLENITKRNLESTRTFLTGRGNARYTSVTYEDILSEREKQGVMELASLDAQEQSLIAQAQNAANDKDFEMLQESISLATKNRDEATKKLAELHKVALERNKRILDEQKLEGDIAEDLAPFVSQFLTGDDETDTALIAQIGKAQGISPIALHAAAQKYRDDQADKDITTDIKEFFRENQLRQASGQAPFKTLEEYRKATAEATRAPKDTPDDEGEKLLTVDESAKLGLPYGTKRKEAFGAVPKKALGETQTTDLTQAQLALRNIQRIEGLIADLGSQGPVIGRFREANPYDTRVVELNNLITQTVPGLARGIFKEVGVLTDTDIERYTKTLANPKLTKEQADNATRQLLETVNFSIRTQLDTLNKAGRDVREFEDLLDSTSKYLLGIYLEKNASAKSKVDAARQSGYSDSEIYDFVKNGPSPSSSSAPTASEQSANTDLSKGIVAGYDIKSYATDPQHEKNVNAIYQKLPPFASAEDADKYIQSIAPGSPIKGADVLAAATKHGVDARLMLAIMQQDSSLGTKGKAVPTKNPGNVGNDDDGNIRNYGDWPQGIEAVALNLKKRKLANA